MKYIQEQIMISGIAEGQAGWAWLVHLLTQSSSQLHMASVYASVLPMFQFHASISVIQRFAGCNVAMQIGDFPLYGCQCTLLLGSYQSSHWYVTINFNHFTNAYSH